jgi:hypothetical protein
MAGIKIGDIENTMDDMSDLLEDANEINDVSVEILGQTCFKRKGGLESLLARSWMRLREIATISCQK